MAINRNMFALTSKDVHLIEVHYYDKNRQIDRNTKPKICVYKAHAAQGISVGNKVVVPFGDTSVYVKTVRAIKPTAEMEDHIDYKWVVSRVDPSIYLQVKERERLFNEALIQMDREEEAKRIKSQLADRFGAEGLLRLESLTVIDSTAVTVDTDNSVPETQPSGDTPKE